MAKKKEETVEILLRIPKSLWKQILQKRPEFKHLPRSAIVRLILTEYVEK